MAADEFADLLRQAQAGHEASFARLYMQVQPVVLRYLGSLAPPDLVEDIAGDTWVSVIRGLDTFRDDDPASFQAWVLTMARRRWIDEVRRRARRPEVQEIGEQVRERPSAADVESEFDYRLSGEAATALVRRLPPDQAEVVMLRAISGLSVEHVAKIVGKTPGAVRVLSHRGLRKLADLVGDVTQSGSRSVGEVR